MKTRVLVGVLLCALAGPVFGAGIPDYPSAITVNPGDYILLTQQTTPGTYTSVKATVSQLAGGASIQSGGVAGQTGYGSISLGQTTNASNGGNLGPSNYLASMYLGQNYYIAQDGLELQNAGIALHGQTYGWQRNGGLLNVDANNDASGWDNPQLPDVGGEGSLDYQSRSAGYGLEDNIVTSTFEHIPHPIAVLRGASSVGYAAPLVPTINAPAAPGATTISLVDRTGIVNGMRFDSVNAQPNTVVTAGGGTTGAGNITISPGLSSAANASGHSGIEGSGAGIWHATIGSPFWATTTGASSGGTIPFSSTAGMLPGMQINGPGVPWCSTITTVPSSTTITVSGVTVTSGVPLFIGGSCTIWAAANVQNTTGGTVPAQGQVLTFGSYAAIKDVLPGELVSGSGLPPNERVLWVNNAAQMFPGQNVYIPGRTVRTVTSVNQTNGDVTFSGGTLTVASGTVIGFQFPGDQRMVISTTSATTTSANVLHFAGLQVGLTYPANGSVPNGTPISFGGPIQAQPLSRIRPGMWVRGNTGIHGAYVLGDATHAVVDTWTSGPPLASAGPGVQLNAVTGPTSFDISIGTGSGGWTQYTSCTTQDLDWGSSCQLNEMLLDNSKSFPYQFSEFSALNDAPQILGPFITCGIAGNQQCATGFSTRSGTSNFKRGFTSSGSEYGGFVSQDDTGYGFVSQQTVGTPFALKRSDGGTTGPNLFSVNINGDIGTYGLLNLGPITGGAVGSIPTANFYTQGNAIPQAQIQVIGGTTQNTGSMFLQGGSVAINSAIVQAGNASAWAANGAVATTMTSLGPTGSHTTIQRWLKVTDDTATVRYIPAY